MICLGKWLSFRESHGHLFTAGNTSFLLPGVSTLTPKKALIQSER